MTAPVTTIQSTSVTKISNQANKNSCTVTFTASQDLHDYTAQALGTSHSTGTKVAGSGNVYPSSSLYPSSTLYPKSYLLTAGTVETFEVDYSEIASNDGTYQVNVYGMNAGGEWEGYEQ